MIKKISNCAHIIFILVWLMILAGFLFEGWDSTWQALSIPTMSPEFVDMRTVQGSIVSLSEGFNPQTNNPGDPYNRAMNYPSIWITIAKIVSMQQETNYLIFVSATVFIFLVCCFCLVKKYPSMTLLLMCFSGATLLAVERGNNDIVIFSLLFLASIFPNSIYIFAIFFAAILKVYPILAIPAYVRSYWSIIAIIIMAAFVFVFLWPEFSTIRSEIPISASLSYGSSSVATAAQYFNINFPSIGISALLLFSSFVIILVQKFRVKLLTIGTTDREKELFLIGGCVYIGTFILSSNWDYRLIFLIFCVPYVMKIKDNLMRITLITLLLCALNQIPLHVVMGTFGIGVNILSKIILFIVFATITLLQLRTKYLNIFHSVR